jgi:hypothetical protein
MRNLMAERRSLYARISRIRRRLAVPVGERRGRLCGYRTSDERFQKQRRLQVLECRLVELAARLEQGRLSIFRGGRSLARARHHLDDAHLSATEWREEWNAARLFITADGEKGGPHVSDLRSRNWTYGLGVEAAGQPSMFNLAGAIEPLLPRGVELCTESPLRHLA